MYELVEALGVDALQQLEPLQGRGRDGAPPDCARVVDYGVDATELLVCVLVWAGW